MNLLQKIDDIRARCLQKSKTLSRKDRTGETSSKLGREQTRRCSKGVKNEKDITEKLNVISARNL